MVGREGNISEERYCVYSASVLMWKKNGRTYVYEFCEVLCVVIVGGGSIYFLRTQWLGIFCRIVFALVLAISLSTFGSASFFRCIESYIL